ncbi:hypothetical protein [Streptomyces ferrugineus]|uniref:hypothetical protein n=1 Tax=Streptomyces ferrugineus TaxID=1413221 RepID=UPI00389A2647
MAAAGPAMPSEDGTLSTVIVYPKTSPQSEGTADLVHHLRADVAPDLERDTGAGILVGGATAASQDFADTVHRRARRHDPGEWERTKDHSLAVREGLAATGKVITAAGAIMQLLGKRAWWLPAPLARRLPKVSLERPAGHLTG